MTLNPEQETADNAIAASLGEAQDEDVLARRDYGSGKTEVYLRDCADPATGKKTAIMLVPEITLTPQMVRRVKGRFEMMLLLVHSGLSEGERYMSGVMLNGTRLPLWLGRGQLFSHPWKNIGLIVLHEEHEPTYKQDEIHVTTPVTLHNGGQNDMGATLVLGSATLSLESRARAQRACIRY